jgi:hypothetical protein
MKNLNTKMALVGLQTTRQRLDAFFNRNYYHMQDWGILLTLLAIVILAIVL